jgi:hypothetical protein
MSAGAVGSLAIYDYILKEDWRKDKAVASGLEWMANHFTVTENPGGPSEHHYYYLYALERTGILYGTETIGFHEWYPEGAKVLLAAQHDDGTWGSGRGGPEVIDTCFAILFLRRATKPLQDVASVDRFIKKP